MLANASTEASIIAAATSNASFFLNTSSLLLPKRGGTPQLRLGLINATTVANIGIGRMGHMAYLLALSSRTSEKTH